MPGPGFHGRTPTLQEVGPGIAAFHGVAYRVPQDRLGHFPGARIGFLDPCSEAGAEPVRPAGFLQAIEVFLDAAG